MKLCFMESEGSPEGKGDSVEVIGRYLNWAERKPHSSPSGGNGLCRCSVGGRSIADLGNQ